MTESFRMESTPARRIALLVDGDNVSPTMAGSIRRRAEALGEVAIRRVYAANPPAGNWRDEGFRAVTSGTGKNATDVLISIDAVHLSHTAGPDTFVIVSSDQDFTHLAHHLRERGLAVVGMGVAAKTPVAFRLACSGFIALLPATKAPEPAPKPKAVPALGELDRALCVIIREAGPQGMLIAALNGAVQKRAQVRISTLPEKNWRAYLTGRPEIYDCDPRGAEAKVRLKPAVKAMV